MNRGFWDNLAKPIVGLAPMDGVTDAAFRYIVAKYGRPSLVMTEFTSVEGIRAGAERLFDDFYYDPIERPVIAQLFGADPSAFRIAAIAAAALGFDGIDINMGCPAKNVTQKGAGAALILDPERAKEIIRQTRAGVEDWRNGINLEESGLPEILQQRIRNWQEKLGLGETTRHSLPVSVKTRIGYDKPAIIEWINHILEAEPVNISIHGRTLKQLYTGLADWDSIASAVPLIHAAGITALGNGDVEDLADAERRIAEYGVDGVLIGRAAFGNPWIFTGRTGTLEERLTIALEHARYLHSIFPGKGFVRIRKHLMDYTKGIEGARDLRMQLMKVNTLEDVEAILAKQA